MQIFLAAAKVVRGGLRVRDSAGAGIGFLREIRKGGIRSVYPCFDKF